MLLLLIVLGALGSFAGLYLWAIYRSTPQRTDQQDYKSEAGFW